MSDKLVNVCPRCANTHWCPRDCSPRLSHVKENRFSGDMIEYGAITALFDDIPASEVGVASGAQSAFDGARIFIKEMVANQCRLAGCSQEHWGFVHTDECWFGKRRAYYADRNAKRPHGGQ